VKIRISPDLVLGADFVTSTSAILAKKRVGKTYLAQKIAEGLLAANQQVVVIDLTSAWWGLRSSADGKSAGYPITIFGGRHGDVPLEATAGEMLAEAIVKDRFSAVLDVRLLKKSQRIRFIADFLEALYDKNTKAMHLFMDEADAYIPQRSFSPEEARALGAADELVRRGGIGGIGVTMISQRAQVLNKNVLSQVDTLSILRMNHPKDIDAVEDWMKNHADGPLIKEILSSLSSLPRGDAWHLDPEHKAFKRISVSAKSTFDSGRTPKVGERIKPPKVLAKVDLERLGESIRETVQRAQDNDPKVLRAKIADLIKERDQLSRTVNAAPTVKVAAKTVEKTKIVEKPVLKDGQLARTEKLIERVEGILTGTTKRVEKTVEDVRETFGEALARAERSLDELRGVVKLVKAAALVPTSAPIEKSWSKGDPLHHAYTSHPPTKATKATKAAKTSKSSAAAKNGTASTVLNGQAIEPPEGLQPVHLRLLSSIAWWESMGVQTPDLEGVAFIAKTSSKSSAFGNNRSRLRAGGYIDYPRTGCMALTEAGRAVAPPPELPRTNEALHEAILQKISPVLGRMLRVLIEAYPRDLPLDELATRAGTSPTSSAFGNNRSWLRARGLATYPRTGFARATELLFPEGS
jgi:hypothetical protein